MKEIWSKSFICNFFINFILYVIFYLLTIILVEYAMDTMAATASEAGLAAGIFVFSGFAGRMITGRCSLRFPLKTLLNIGLGIFLLASILYFVSHTIWLLYIVRIIHGIGFGIAATATGTITAAIIPNRHRGEGIGYFGLSVTLATAIGPFLGMWLQRYSTYSVILVICAVLALLNMAVALFLHIPDEKSAGSSRKPFCLSDFVEYSAVPMGIIGAFIGLSYSSIVSFLSLYIKETGYFDAGNWFFLVYAACIILSRPFVGRWLDEKGENFIMYPLYLLFAMGMALLGHPYHSLFILLAAGLIGVGYGSFISTAQAISVKQVPPHRIGVATATFLALFDMGMGMGSYVLGIFVPILGYAGLYMAMAVLILICMILYYIFHGRHVSCIQ